MSYHDKLTRTGPRKLLACDGGIISVEILARIEAELHAASGNPELVKPAVEAAGLRCVRADEIVHSGLIDVPMYEQLLKADVVVADLSTSNRNAIYELGVRHALRPFTTVIVAAEGMMKSPFFDLNRLVFRNYRHLGEDIGVNKARRFTGELTRTIREIMAKEPKLRRDSPVYQFVERLTPPAVAEATAEALAAVADTRTGATAGAGDDPHEGHSHSVLMCRVDKAQEQGDFLRAKMLLEDIRDMRRAGNADEAGVAAVEKAEDPYILQRLAFATYKSQYPTPEEALTQAHELLAVLEPWTSNDPETLGLWGSIHKQLWDRTRDANSLDEAVHAYRRGFYLSNDYYSGINYAFLLNVRAANNCDPAEAITDFVLARRVRGEVMQICESELAHERTAGEEGDGGLLARSAQESRYWVLATMAEACFGVGDTTQGQRWLDEALALAPEAWMSTATREQLGKLDHLLASSPLGLIELKVPIAVPPVIREHVDH